MPKRLLRLPGAILVLATSGCFLFGAYPTTWEGRYKKALDELEAAQTDIGRFYALNNAAKAAFEVGKIEKARAHAQEALDLALRFRDDWNYGNAIHDGHMVLGRIALRNGDLEIAKRELVEAGRTPGSPQLNSFGPNMSLASLLSAVLVFVGRTVRMSRAPHRHDRTDRQARRLHSRVGPSVVFNPVRERWPHSGR